MSYQRKQYDKKKYLSKLLNGYKKYPSTFGQYYYNKYKKRIIRLYSNPLVKDWKTSYNKKIRRKYNQILKSGEFEKGMPSKKEYSDVWDVT